MKNSRHLVPILMFGVFLAAIVGFASSSMTHQALVITALSVAYLLINLFYSLSKRTLNVTRVMEISAIALIAQFSLLYLI